MTHDHTTNSMKRLENLLNLFFTLLNLSNYKSIEFIYFNQLLLAHFNYIFF